MLKRNQAKKKKRIKKFVPKTLVFQFGGCTNNWYSDISGQRSQLQEVESHL